ncbi:hypothetical protein [Amantichitinum ursilacus]|uniref:DUF2147 domain-containing protein n=1 Tax=Amantichitinum ursilacus TaxID=857265 RepID=A0A0N0GPZ8_9NEIS|nr:hypothetical protein [Amantichitinum ursilacus]KPC54264.1 hypothetical protein WG78_06430 [Amantichitinum ursilacus]
MTSRLTRACAGLLLLLLHTAYAATALPEELTGIWTTRDSVLRGEALASGRALVLDSDGVGAALGADGKRVDGVRLEVTAYDPQSHTLQLNILEGGNVIANGIAVYNPGMNTLSFRKDTFWRRTRAVSATARSGLGLEARAP